MAAEAINMPNPVTNISMAIVGIGTRSTVQGTPHPVAIWSTSRMARPIAKLTAAARDAVTANTSPGTRILLRTERPAMREEPQATAPCEKNRSEEHTSELQSRENLVCRL